MKWSGISVPSTFIPAHRPVYLHPVVEMNRKNREQAYPMITEAIGKILERENGKGLVHTVSYDLAGVIAEHNSGGRIFTYRSSRAKGDIIPKWLQSKSGVMVAPSLERGIDLPNTTCRFIIVAKLPFPNLGTKQVSARLHSRGGQLWYTVRTIRSLVQMTGRGMRHENDYCNSYILDKQFLTQIWNRNRQLLPDWWKEALVWNAGSL